MSHRKCICSPSFQLVLRGVSRICVLWLSIAVGLSSGCGRPEIPQSDVHQARELLTETLDAWVGGETLDDQRAKDPPVYVAEDLWFSNTPLNRYELNNDGELVGTNVRFHVTLHGGTRNRGGNPREVYYLVTTVPARTVAREDR